MRMSEARIKALARQHVGNKNIKVTVTDRFPDVPGAGSTKFADGLAVMWPNGDCEMFIHKAMKYYSPIYVDDVIGHEMDHLNVYKKIYGAHI